MRIISTLILGLCLHVTKATPPDCRPVEDHVLDNFDPRGIFGTNAEIAKKQSPHRVGNLRSKGPIPTGHFVTSQLKNENQRSMMVLWPYFATMDRHGIVYDAFTFDRFWDPDRSVTMGGQTPWVSGQQWNRLVNLGTNMAQKVTGTDGNKVGSFDGHSGVKVGIAGSGEPELQDFGELYANFLYSGNGGSMEVPLVRGSGMLTHIFRHANPVVKPYCLDNINGQRHTFDCPKEPSWGAGGTGFLSGSCTGSTLTISLHNTRSIKDVTKIQWAAGNSGQYGSHHGMHTCDAGHCSLKDKGQTVEIRVPNASGEMSFAINYIGQYLLPPDWVNHPMKVTCTSGGKRRSLVKRALKKRGPGDISLVASCDSHRNVEVRVDLASNNINGVSKVQIALEPATSWGNPPAMRTCSPSTCQREGHTVIYRKKASADHLKLAINVIGLLTIPYQYWIEHPLDLYCGSGHTVHAPHNVPWHPQTHPPPVQTTPQTRPATHPVVATPAVTNAPATHPPVTDPQFTQPVPGHVLTITPGTKYILELNEQGTDLPHQTRKFVLYFSERVTPHVNTGANTITFIPQSGANYNGIMQLGYIGAGPRGDHSNDTALDKYAGVFPYKPKASYCVSESQNKAYTTFSWNPNNQHASSPISKPLMIAMPHHTLLLRKMSASLFTSVFGFQGYDSVRWELTMDLPRASMTPDDNAVQRIIGNSAQKQDIINAIDRDARNQNLDAICARADSYNVGKAIGMVARLASISRAFHTNHYHSLDTSVKNCLEKWLRIQDILWDQWKFRYDTVWGGLFLRSTTSSDVGFGYDYGFPYYNDHHFHLGYFIYAMAYYVKYYPQWGQANRPRIYAVARDVGNPSPRDPFFPVARQKDMYTGFSWASGIVPGGRQEESSSEGINCYHGLAALGDAFNDPVLKHTGQVFLAMELQSVREYWQVRNHNRHHFPPMIQKYGVVGMVTEDSFYAYTLNWPCDPNKFPMRHACLVGIQVIPITAVSKYWVDQEWAASIRHSCESAIHPETEADFSKTNPAEMRKLNGAWAGFCYAAMAPLDAAHNKQAADFIRNKRPQDLVGGTGAASTLLFIYGST